MKLVLLIWIGLVYSSCGNTSSEQKEKIVSKQKIVSQEIKINNVDTSSARVTDVSDKPLIDEPDIVEAPVKKVNTSRIISIDPPKNEDKNDADSPEILEIVSEPDIHQVPDLKETTDIIEEDRPVKPKEKAPIKATVPDAQVDLTTAWDALLMANVSKNGIVNYKAFKKSIPQLNDYLDLLSINPPDSDWGRDKQMSYWINVYNANTIKLILDNYPLGSITDLHGGKPWDVKWIKIGDHTYSLNNIEHDIIRPRFKDERIHFAVNCAAKSCPPIWNRAWTPSNLEMTLERKASEFINNPSYNTLGDTPQVSKIFEWYAEDFGDLVKYLNKYSAQSISDDAPIQFSEYNWSLNE